jgi:hypothetical protein
MYIRSLTSLIEEVFMNLSLLALTIFCSATLLFLLLNYRQNFKIFRNKKIARKISFHATLILIFIYIVGIGTNYYLSSIFLPRIYASKAQNYIFWSFLILLPVFIILPIRIVIFRTMYRFSEMQQSIQVSSPYKIYFFMSAFFYGYSQALFFKDFLPYSNFILTLAYMILTILGIASISVPMLDTYNFKDDGIHSSSFFIPWRNVVAYKLQTDCKTFGSSREDKYDVVHFHHRCFWPVSKLLIFQFLPSDRDKVRDLLNLHFSRDLYSN